MDKIPQVKNCCFVIPLKVGTIIVVIISLLLACGASGVGAFLGVDCSTKEGVLHDIADIFGYVLWVASLLLVFSCIAFLFGIFLDKAITAKIYIIVGLVFLLFYILYSVVYIMAKISCRIPIGNIVMLVLNALCWFYFIVVAKSYMTSEMGGD